MAKLYIMYICIIITCISETRKINLIQFTGVLFVFSQRSGSVNYLLLVPSPKQRHRADQ